MGRIHGKSALQSRIPKPATTNKVTFVDESPRAFAYHMMETCTTEEKWSDGVHITYDQYKEIGMKCVWVL